MILILGYFYFLGSNKWIKGKVKQKSGKVKHKTGKVIQKIFFVRWQRKSNKKVHFLGNSNKKHQKLGISNKTGVKSNKKSFSTLILSNLKKNNFMSFFYCILILWLVGIFANSFKKKFWYWKNWNFLEKVKQKNFNKYTLDIEKLACWSLWSKWSCSNTFFLNNFLRE